jgi:hypothetical protein
MKPGRVWIAGVVAAGLVILPWLPWPRPMEVPSGFALDHPAFGVLVGLARDLDRVCERGDVRGIEKRTTGAFRAELARQLEGIGKALDADALRETRALIGELRAEDLQAGRATADRAVLVFRQRSYGLPAREFLLGVVFAWDGYRFLVHGVGSRMIGRGDSGAQGVQELAADLLESRRPQG